MTDRPQWARNILSFLSDGIIDEDYPEDGSADTAAEEIEQFAKDRLCQEFGHVIYDDQCNIPEHRFCGWCNRRETAIKERETAKAHPDPAVTAAERDVIAAAKELRDGYVHNLKQPNSPVHLPLIDYDAAVARLTAARRGDSDD